MGILVLLGVPLSCLAQNAPGATEVDKIKARLKQNEPIVWVITGDSITHGALHTCGWRSYPEHLAERVRWELHRHRDVVINTGISGDVVPGLLKDLDHRVIRFQPDVVSIMMGMNDCSAGPGGRQAFAAAYDQLIDQLRSRTKALIIVQTPNPITPVDTRRSDLPAYSDIIRKMAARRGIALVDQEQMWKQYLARPGADLNYLLNDGTIHPNNHGHVLFAVNMFKVLNIYDENAPTCRLFVP